MSRLPVITLCPAGTVHVASSRLRCHVLARELGRLGCTTHLGIQPDVLPDVLYVQKLVTPEILVQARAVKARGGRVIFDIDDWGDALAWVKADPALLADFLALTDVVSVDTDVRREVFSQDPVYQAVPQFWVIADPVDYVDEIAAPAGRDVAPQGLVSGCWFGNGPNFMPALPYVQAAAGTGRLARFSVITNGQFVPQFQQAWPMLGVEAWQLDSFASRLREHDFCLLIHDTNTEGIQKSNNKMLAALGQGVVPLVSNTPAYAETAAKIGIPELVINGPDDLAAALHPERLQALQTKVRGDTCRRALREFMPASVARGFLDKVIQLTQSDLLERPAAVAVPAPQPIRLNLGCGDMPLPGYVNVDVAVERAGKQPDVCADVRDLSVFASNHADEVMAIHVIEHFHRWEVVDILKEWVRVLKPGGRLVLECPNLISACEALLKDPAGAAGPGQEGSRSMWCFYGDPSWKDPLMCHKWLYTPQSLAQVMAEAGLTQLAQTPPWFKAKHPRDMRLEGIKA
ncbi:MAG: methyltransferase domain-containing protein [Burkholderiales bacterium]